MFEEGLPWFVPSAAEIHAFLYGVKDTFTRKSLVAWNKVDTEYAESSPLIIAQIKEKHHYYAAGFYTPRIAVVVVVAVRFLVFTDILNSKEAITTLVSLLFGV